MPKPKRIKSKKEPVPLTAKKQLPHPEVNQEWNRLKEKLKKLIDEFPELPLKITPREYGEYYYPKQAEWLRKLKKLVGA